MKKFLSLIAMLAMTIAFGFNPVSADEMTEEEAQAILEECILEAHNRGYDIESDAFIKRLTTALINGDEKTGNQICPKTNAKYE